MLKRKNIIAIITVLAVVATILSLQIFKRALFRITSEFYHPFFSPVSNAENYSLKQSLLLRSKSELADELLKLQKQHEEEKAELQLLRSVKDDKRRLEELHFIHPEMGYKFIAAEIYKRDPAYWYESFSVNKGGLFDIEPGAIVLCRTSNTKNNKHTFAVVGRVSEVTQHKSQIQTIVSHKCKLSVLLKDSKAAGILEGGTIKNGKPEIKVTYLPTFKTYKQGEEVFTSGLCKGPDTTSEKITQHSTPSGLFVGTISGEIKMIKKLKAEAKITPAVDFDSLRYVIILVKDNQNIIKTN